MSTKASSTRRRLASSSAARTSTASRAQENTSGRDEEQFNDENVNVREGEGKKYEDDDTGESDGETRGWSPCGKKKTVYVCKGGPKPCGQRISPREDCIRCDACSAWFHPKCQTLSNEEFKALSKFDFIWLCMECKPMLKSLVDLKKDLESRIESTENKVLQGLSEIKKAALSISEQRQDVEKEIERKLAKMEDKLLSQIKGQQTHVDVSLHEQTRAVQAQIKEQQVRVDASLHEQAKVVQTLPKCTEDLRSSAKDLKKMVEDRADKEAREVNVLIHNISESKSENPEERKGHDLEVFRKVVASLIGEQEHIQVDKIFRLGKRETATQDTSRVKPRLMMVKLKEKEHVNMLVKRRTQLKDVGFPNVYLTRDLPPEEREAQKKLRQELRDKGKVTHRIFRGRVVPRE